MADSVYENSPTQKGFIVLGGAGEPQREKSRTCWLVQIVAAAAAWRGGGSGGSHSADWVCLRGGDRGRCFLVCGGARISGGRSRLVEKKKS